MGFVTVALWLCGFVAISCPYKGTPLLARYRYKIRSGGSEEKTCSEGCTGTDTMVAAEGIIWIAK